MKRIMTLAVAILAFCSRAEPTVVAQPPRPPTTVAAAQSDPDAREPEPRVTEDEIITMMSRVPVPCALTGACSRFRTVVVSEAPAARDVAFGIADAVNAAWATGDDGRVLLSRHEDAAMLVVFAVGDSNLSRCKPWHAVVDPRCSPGSAAWSWLHEATRTREDCMSDHGNLDKDPPVNRPIPGGDGMEMASTSLSEAFGPLIAVSGGSCLSMAGRKQSDQRFRLAEAIGAGERFEIDEEGYIEPYWDWSFWAGNVESQWTSALEATDTERYHHPQLAQYWSAFDAMGR